MKNFLIILIAFYSVSISFAQERIPSDPIPGVDVKLGRKPPGGGQIIASGKTNEKGEFDFKNLAPGIYYVEFAIKEKGIKNATQAVISEDIMLSTSSTAVNPTATRDAVIAGNPQTQQKSKEDPNLVKTKKIMTDQYGEVELVVTYQGDMIRGSINVSRSNIKINKN
jgi:hypothetical protein